MSDGEISLTADGVASYLRCPRRYEFAHVDGLAGDGDESPTAERLAVLRAAICDALRTGAADPDDLEAAALERLGALWAEHEERVHSRAQRRHERRVLEATVRAYVDAVGDDHAPGAAALRSKTDAAVLGPSLPVHSRVALPELEARATVAAPIDYAYASGSSLVGVRFVPTARPLGLLRYRDEWEGDVADRFAAHFDPAAEAFEPDLVGALFETAVVLDGLRALRDRLELSSLRTCRYVQLPLAERSALAVNWMRETVETTVEPIDLTDPFLDHHTFGMTHEHRNRAVERRLAEVVRGIVAGRFEPGERLDSIVENACPNCAYTVCCEEYIATEVRFDG